MAVYKIDGFGTRNQTDGSGFDGNFERREKFIQMYASETLTKGQVVCLDFDVSTYGVGNNVKLADRNATKLRQGIGVAAEGITITGTDYKLVKIQVAGVCDAAVLDNDDDGPGQLVAPGDTAGSMTLMIELNSSEEYQLPVGILIADTTPFSAAAAQVYLLNPLNL